MTPESPNPPPPSGDEFLTKKELAIRLRVGVRTIQRWQGAGYLPYRQVRNRKVNEALVQGVETARAILETTPQGQAADSQFVKWLMEHQKEASVFTTVAALVDQVSDNPAAKLTAQEIAERVKKAQSAG